VGLNPPIHTQHNEDVGGYNEGNLYATIRRLGADNNEGGISNTHPSPWAPMSLKRGGRGKLNNGFRIGSNTTLEFGLGLTQP